MALGHDPRPNSKRNINEVLNPAIQEANGLLEQSRMVDFGDQIMANSELIRNLCDGDPETERVFFTGFGNFVQRFPAILDRRIREGVNRGKMRANRFGKENVMPHLIDIIRSVRTMREEESDHAGLWWKAARKVGVDMDQSNLDHLNTPEMQDLISYADTADVRQALAAAKATEEIAGALSRILLSSPRFVERQGGEFQWGEVHVSPDFLEAAIGRRKTAARGAHNHDMLEHDDVDKLLLIAHDDSPAGIEDAKAKIRQGMILFARAALSLEQHVKTGTQNID